MGQIVCTDKGILAVEQNKVLIPPAWNKTFAWGYADLSCRLGTYESDKVRVAGLLQPRPFVVWTTGLNSRGEARPGSVNFLLQIKGRAAEEQVFLGNL